MYSCKTKCNKNSEFIKTHGDLKKKIELERPKKSQDGKGRSQEKSWAEDLGNNQTEAKKMEDFSKKSKYICTGIRTFILTPI